MNKTIMIRMSFICMLVLMVVVTIPLRSAKTQSEQNARSLAAVYYDNQDELNNIGGKYDVWAVYPDKGYAEVLLKPEDQTILIQAGYRVEVLREIPANTQALLDPRYYYYDNYVTNSNNLYITNWLQTTNSTYPALTELYDVGNAWQKDHGGYGRDMWVMRVTNEDPQYGSISSKPAFFMIAEIHAREVATPELTMRYIKYLLGGFGGQGGYGVDADVTWLVNHNVAYFMVMQNPDGHIPNEQNPSAYRRKNMNNTKCGTPSAWGIDLNRNHSFLWGCCGGSSGSGCDETYRGSSAGSEPETQAFQMFFTNFMLDQNGPNGDNQVPPAAPDNTTGIFISLHSYADEILWPWYLPGYPSAPNQAQMQVIGRKMATYNSMSPTGTIGYTVDGSSDIWAYGKFGIPSFTLEVGPNNGTCAGFFPPYDCIDGYGGRDFWAENLPAFMYAHKIARKPYMTTYGPDALTPAITQPGNGEATVTLTATIKDTRYGSDPLKPVMGAEYFIGVEGQDGSGIAMNPSDGSWGSTSEAVIATIDTTGMLPGKYYVLVHGKNSDGKWGPFSATWLTVEASQSTVHVGNIQMRYRTISTGRYRLIAGVPILNQDGLTVAGVSVTVQWSLPNGKTITQTAVTSTKGLAVFNYLARNSGLFTVTVLDVVATGYTYDPDQNFETSEELIIP